MTQRGDIGLNHVPSHGTARRCPSLAVRTICAVLVAVPLLCAGPRAGRSETLTDALIEAYLANPAIQADRARQRANDEAVPQAASGWLPKANLNSEVGKTRTRRVQPFDTNHHQPQGINVTLSQPLFTGFQTLNATREAGADVRAGREQLYQTEQSVLLDAVRAYMDVIRDRRIARLRADNVSFLSTELKATQTRQREGDLSKTDVAQARARYHEGQSALAQARADVKSSEATYESVIGHRPGQLSPAPSFVRLLPPSLGAALGTAEEENPLVIAAEFRKDAAEYALKKAYGQFMPSVSLDAQHGRDYDTLDGFNRETDSSVYLRLAMPLYQGGTLSSQVRQARETYKQRDYEASDTRNRVVAAVHDTWQQLQAAQSRVRSNKLSVRAADEALKGVRIEAEVGERAIFEVLDAQRELVNTQVAVASAERDVIVSRFALLAAAGRLSAGQLDLPVENYDPKANLTRVIFHPLSGVLSDPARRAGDYEYETYDVPPPPLAAPMPTGSITKAPPPQGGGWTVKLELPGEGVPLPQRSPAAKRATAATGKAPIAEAPKGVTAVPASHQFSFDMEAD